MSTRRLAAIMFTDIAGYTAMMQENEARAVTLRTRHREVFERQHAAFRGQIVQYYGDGTLSVFDSAVDAAACAVAMQSEFREEPQVPLRIGIHTGDIMISATEVIGDGVNVASRVESLAVPGSVLVSESVYDNIKNQVEFEGKSLGIFTFKNVSKPTEVFALTGEGLEVPNPKKLEGKYIKRESKEKDWFQRMPIWTKYVAGFVLFLALAPIIYSPLTALLDAGAKPNMMSFLDENGNTVMRQVIPMEEKRTLLLGSFTNLSGDSTLDWVKVGIPYAMEMDFDQDPYIYNLYETKEIDATMKEIMEKAQREKCQYIVNGSFTKLDDTYKVQISLLTMPSGQKFQELSFEGTELLPLIDDISYQIKEALGLPEEHLSTFSDLPLTAVLTHSPEAYKTFATGLMQVDAADPTYFNTFEQVLKLDSTFSWAALLNAQILYYYQRGQKQQKEAISLAMRHKDRLPEMFSMEVRQFNYRVNDQPEKSYELIKLMTQMEPDKASSWSALIRESFIQRDFETCLVALKQYRELRGEPSYQLLSEASCLLWLGRAKEGIEVINQYLKDNPKDREGILLQGELYLAENKPELARSSFEKGSLFYPEVHSFEKMVKHCDYLKEHQNLSEAEAQKYLGTYWMVQMTQFQLEVGYELGHLTIRAGEQPKILMYPYSETEFAMTFTARVEFFTDTTTGGIRNMIFEQDGQGAYMSAHIDESVEKAFDAIKKKDYESASTDIAEAIAANPSFSILGSIQEFLSFRKSNTDALTRYKALEGSYLLNGRELTIEIQQGELRFFAAGNSYGMDAHTLLEFKPDHFIVLDNLGNYLQFERGPRGVKGVTYHEFKSDKTIFAEKIR